MNKFKLQFDEEMRSSHEIIIETKLTWDELSDKLDEMNFDDCVIGDCAIVLKEDDDIKVLEVIEQDPETSNMECVDIREIK
jgi:hypothetical protein